MDTLINLLQGRISAAELRLVKESTAIRFNDSSGAIQDKEALILAEQHLLPEEEIRELLSNLHDVEFEQIKSPYVTPDVIKMVEQIKDAVPLKMDTVESVIYIGVRLEHYGQRTHLKRNGHFEVKEMPITIYDYVRLYRNTFKKYPDFISDYPVSDLLSYIYQEGISLGASDITISEKDKDVHVYYNINKRTVDSQRLLPKEKMQDAFDYITGSGKQPASFTGRNTLSLSIDLDHNHRGRVEVNRTYHGWMFTIRILSNNSINTLLRDLNLPETAIGSIQRDAMNMTPGLKLFCGPTMSGKNTTIMSALYEYTKNNKCKVTSFEQPVEIIADFLEQIDCATDEDYTLAVNSSLRQNSDITYFVEMTSRTAEDVIKAANTGKGVISTIHANSIAEVPSRIRDLTGLSLSQIIMTIDYLYYQTLIPKLCPKCEDMGCPDCHKAGMVPVVEYLKFNETLKNELIGLDLAQIYSRISHLIRSSDKTANGRELLEKGIISRRVFENYLGKLV